MFIYAMLNAYDFNVTKTWSLGPDLVLNSGFWFICCEALTK